MEMIVSTGNRPILSVIGEIRTSINSASESLETLAAFIDPNLPSCGTISLCGEKELRHLEKDSYIIGSKSYGRALTLLMATSYEQVRSIVTYFTRTGVCNID
ncbi:hypothetical protein CN264_24620 [Bacillus cereus]|nr:hypothetical protein CN264_24620 [Bacillus cereus]